MYLCLYDLLRNNMLHIGENRAAVVSERKPSWSITIHETNFQKLRKRLKPDILFLSNREPIFITSKIFWICDCFSTKCRSTFADQKSRLMIVPFQWYFFTEQQSHESDSNNSKSRYGRVLYFEKCCDVSIYVVFTVTNVSKFLFLVINMMSAIEACMRLPVSGSYRFCRGLIFSRDVKQVFFDLHSLFLGIKFCTFKSYKMQ